MTGSAKISSHLPPRGPLGRSRVLATCARLLLSLAVVAGVTHVCATFLHVNPATAGFLYLLVILGVATKFGLFESTIVSVAAMLSLNFFFIPPTGTFTIADPQNWVAMLTFLATSLTASQLSERLKRERREAVVRQRELEQLYAFSRGLLLADPSQPVPK